MAQVVKVRFKQAGRAYDFRAEGFEDLKPGDMVIVDTAHGEDLGEIVQGPHEIVQEESPDALKPVLRRAQDWELREKERMEKMEPEALQFCREKVAELGLPMKIIKAQYSYGGGHLTFFFSAESRVDFRDLVKTLAGRFHTRIELRQIGVRDEAKLLGGIGRCGRELCCATFLCGFSPVSIRMAKNQNLPLNPAEISGLCGRLLCCLSYENEMYSQMRTELPPVGRRVRTPQGTGKVIAHHVIREMVMVELEESGKIVELEAADLEEIPS